VNCLSLGTRTQQLEENNGKVVMHKDKKYYYQCLVCSMMFTGWTPPIGKWKVETCVKRHSEVIDLSSGMECPVPGCPSPSVAKRGLINVHIQEHHPDLGKVCCCQCSELVDSTPQDYLRGHFLKLHHTAQTKRVQCPQCGKVLTSKGLKDHIQHIHEKDKAKFVCPVCADTFPSLVKLSAHNLRTHAPKNLACLHCDKSFQNDKAVWERHLVTHTNLKPFKCALCPYDSNRKGNIHVHVKNTHHRAYDKELIVVDQTLRKKLNDIIRADIEVIRANANLESRIKNKYKETSA